MFDDTQLYIGILGMLIEVNSRTHEALLLLEESDGSMVTECCGSDKHLGMLWQRLQIVHRW